MKYRYIGILLVFGLVSSIPAQVAAQESLTMSINRNVGIGLGGLIQGTFTLHGSGPEIVQNLTVILFALPALFLAFTRIYLDVTGKLGQRVSSTPPASPDL